MDITLARYRHIFYETAADNLHYTVWENDKLSFFSAKDFNSVQKRSSNFQNRYNVVKSVGF